MVVFVICPISPIYQCFSLKLLKVVVFPWTWWVVAGELAPPGRYLHAAAASMLPAALSRPPEPLRSSAGQ